MEKERKEEKLEGDMGQRRKERVWRADGESRRRGERFESREEGGKEKDSRSVGGGRKRKREEEHQKGMMG